MGKFMIPWGLTGTLFAASYLHAICTTASPSINVGLKTSFDSAPYLLELLETAGDENSTSYFPLLDRIADGYFATATTDKELYKAFIKVLHDDGHLDGPALSSYQLALSLRSAAPRIEAHYQFYHASVEPSIGHEEDTLCPVWVQFNGAQYCSPSLDSPHGEFILSSSLQDLPFDRVYGNSSAPSSILYADVTSPLFAKFHKTLIRTARLGKTSYRVRYRKSSSLKTAPLTISGYGVELALKRTDYIVIDDRDKKDSQSDIESATKAKLDDQEVADLKPLSTSELSPLSLKAASFVMQSEDPFSTLIKLSQDFPKYSAAISAHNFSTDFQKEHEENREILAPAGLNLFWINGVQVIDRQVDAFTLLDMLRRERKLVNNVQGLGLTGQEATSLLSHSVVLQSKVEDEPQRFDWRDWEEGSNVIIWLNNLEKDKRYSAWSDDLKTLLQRTYPGQIPSVKRDIFNLVIPVDVSDSEEVLLVVETIQSFVKRKLPLRFGLVPLIKTPGALEQAKVLYHLLDAYGIGTVLAYLESTYKSQKTSSASSNIFDGTVKGRKLRTEQSYMSLQDVLKESALEDRISNLKKWTTRLSADTATPPVFVNGVALPRNENWLQLMSNRVTTDLQSVQRGVHEETIDSTTWLPGYFLAGAVGRRNSLVIPEDESNLKMYDVSTLYSTHTPILNNLARVTPGETLYGQLDWVHVIVIADLSSVDGRQFLKAAAEFRGSNPGVELNVMNNAVNVDGIFDFLSPLKSKTFFVHELLQVIEEYTNDNYERSRSDETLAEAQQYLANSKAFVEAIGLRPGQNGLLVNGRLVGPVQHVKDFVQEDFSQLLAYERKKRIIPAYRAMELLGLSSKIANSLAGAKVSSAVAISTISDVPDGMFEQGSTLRINKFDLWASIHTAIEVGDFSTAPIRITAAVDPASEQAQRWLPILKVLSELEGVYMKLFLNPKDRLQELPVKRFYRYVLDSKPNFHEDGSLASTGAIFSGVPQEALLTVGMDVPPPWLVAPKVSVHDLDNIKLSKVKTDIEALYELENILIEGHSREVTGGSPPRGAQLVLGTERDSHFADTIIMSNLGYFQFKANPGFYTIGLQSGRSSEIFKIDSLGSQGWAPVPGDESNEIALMSFQGTTLYPRLSRKPGQETEDVLESKANSTMDFVNKGVKYAESWLGFSNKRKEAAAEDIQADINIFSVASGHLYERMLNIMMVSVMKHTKHTVKFWFIEQFLSPSFKDFIPHLAAEYGFQYEMVTYKWPHWLRAQTEKQREIWGYKILFLDVLFPLALDKVIFVDADQIVRTDMIELVNHDLKEAPYGFTPMCDSRTEMEGFRFWKQGYWKNFLKGLPYHISALYVVDLHRFRQIAAGDRLRQQYHQLSADPNSLSNLDQDLPNHMQSVLPIHSLPQEWLWCETWCSDESLKEAKTIDLCNNPQTKEPKLDRARRQVPEWTVYDDEIAAVDQKRKGTGGRQTAVTAEEKITLSKKLEETAKPHIVDEL